MRKVTKFFMAVLLAGMCSLGYAQIVYEWKQPPKPTEKEVGLVTASERGGWYYLNKKRENVGEHRYVVSDEKLYEKLLSIARSRYGTDYPKLILRNFRSICYEDQDPRYNYSDNTTTYHRLYEASATVVVPDAEIETNKNLSKAFDKALRNIPENSRMAIDQVTIVDGVDVDALKDQILDVLLDKGFRVLAKEYLERLQQEQQDQLSGLYNEGTTVQGNNFSAVGYFINVKVTETSLRVQVVNVSTGEYEGNATVNF